MNRGMKKVSGMVLMVIASAMLMGPDCRPDLVPNASGVCDGNTYALTVVMTNSGAGPAGKSLLYTNAIDPAPPSGQNEIRIQESERVGPFMPGASFQKTYGYSIADLAGKEIDRFDVLADSKNMVKESNEANNMKTLPYPGCP